MRAPNGSRHRERDTPIECLIDLHFGSGEAKAASLLGDLEAMTLPLHDVVVADRTFVQEAADAVEAVWSRTPGGFSRPNWVGWRFPASCSSTVQPSSLRTKMPL
jgi:hypothetical protein